MVLRSEPVEILARGLYDEEDPKFGEFLRVMAPGDESTRRYTLAVNGEGERDAIRVGATVTLVLQSRMRAKPYQRRDGSLDTRYVEQLRIVDVEPVAA